MKTLLLFALLAQQEETIPRSHKGVYLEPVSKCEEARKLLETNPDAATAILDDIIANKKLEKIERRLKIEKSVADTIGPFDFFPYQFRGVAAMNRARKSGSATAEKFLAQAIEDFKESVSRGVSSSESYRKTAEAELEKAQAILKNPSTAPDPRPDFTAKWNDLLRRQLFVSARDHVDKNGNFLDPADRQDFLARTDEECRAAVEKTLREYLRTLHATTPKSLAEMSPQDVESYFPLPDLKQVCVKSEKLDWAVSFREILDRLRRQEDVLDSLFRHVVSASPLESKNANPWFQEGARLACALLESQMAARRDQARDAPAAERQALRSDAEALRKRWTDLENGLPRDVRDRHGFLAQQARALDAILAQFPMDSAEVRKARADIDRTFDAELPEATAELERIEKSLAKIHAEQGNTLTRESRQELLTCLIVAASLRRFLAGDSVDQVSALPAPAGYGPPLKEMGGAIDVNRYGGKVARVFKNVCR